MIGPTKLTELKKISKCINGAENDVMESSLIKLNNGLVQIYDMSSKFIVWKFFRFSEP